MLICLTKEYFTQAIKMRESFARIDPMAEGLNLTWNNKLKSCKYEDFITFYLKKSNNLAGVLLSFPSACFIPPLCSDEYTWKGQKRERGKKKGRKGSWEYHKTIRRAGSCCNLTNPKTRPLQRKQGEVWKIRCLLNCVKFIFDETV